MLTHVLVLFAEKQKACAYTRPTCVTQQLQYSSDQANAVQFMSMGNLLGTFVPSDCRATSVSAVYHIHCILQYHHLMMGCAGTRWCGCGKEG